MMRVPSHLKIPLGFASAKLLLHLITNWWGGYGIFRDELYYLACSRNLAFGYVDQPPLSIFILFFSRSLFGESIFALRFLPALSGAATVFLIGLLAHRMGGGRWAQALACLASLVSLIYLGFCSIYSMNVFDILLWTATAYLLVRLIQTENPHLWIGLGLILGLGLLNKIGVLWLGFGILVGLLATPQRRWLKTWWPYLAGMLALGLFLPYVVWNLNHDLAHLEFIERATSGKYSGLSPISFLVGQFLAQNPVTLPLWLAGLGFLFWSRTGKAFRLLGFVYLTALIVLLSNQHTKAEYLSAAYGMLFAGGGVGLEKWLSNRRWRWVRPAYATVLAAGLFLAPVALPILPVETYIRYAETIGVAPSTAEQKELKKLPQFYADMFGWKEKAEAVAKVYHALPEEEKADAAIFAGNYGRCGAIDHFGRELGLPGAIGSHNNYWIWGPRGHSGEVVILLGGDLESNQRTFEEVEVAGFIPCTHCMPYESDLTIYVGRKIKIPIEELWPDLKHYD